MQKVIIDPECFFTLITASLEVYNCESTGMIVGNFRQRKLNGSKERVVVLEAAHPFQTAKRRPTWCDIGNLEAFSRARGSLLSLDYSMVGEFHSHPNRSIALSDADISYIQQRASEIYESGNQMLNHYWLELVLSVKKRFYKHPHKLGWKWRRRKNRVECIVKMEPYIGYVFSIGGFWIDLSSENGRRFEAKLGLPRSFNKYRAS